MAPDVSWIADKGTGIPFFSYVYSANACAVKVDTETGRVDVETFFSAHDIGRSVNPQQCMGQIYGGAAMGIGYALAENIEVREGKIINDNFNRYFIPTACDLPEFEGIILENPDPEGPYGSKSLGEPAIEVVAPAVINAIADATGKRIFDLPASPAAVIKSLQKDNPG